MNAEMIVGYFFNIKTGEVKRVESENWMVLFAISHKEGTKWIQISEEEAERIALAVQSEEDAFEIVKAVADVWGKEEEYAGRMETWCFYCGEYQERKMPEAHKEDCLHIKAKKIVEKRRKNE